MEKNLNETMAAKKQPVNSSANAASNSQTNPTANSTDSSQNI